MDFYVFIHVHKELLHLSRLVEFSLLIIIVFYLGPLIDYESYDHQYRNIILEEM